ncbi:MAG: YdcF family protein, partial [Rikenellaceae bacterium]
MFYEISKFFSIFISPITWIIILLILFFVFRKNKKLKVTFLTSTIVLFLLSTNMLLVDYVRCKTVEDYNVSTIDTTKHYRVAIIMGGFSSMNEETGAIVFENGRADRLWETVRLYKQGYVDNILITGDGATNINEDGTTTADLFLDYMEQTGVERDVFMFEQ